MKVNTNSKKKFKTENNSGIILSIGMIVKNEEKVLERCLKSLQPLMEAIPSELIIADTGSTDSTVEIAKKYTDNVFHFEWINDFAAARNSTLEKARGQWFLFVDADEYLDDDIGEMVHFFKNEELRSKYKTLEINVRSYTNEEKTEYRDGCLVRFQRIDDPDDPVHFIGRVHEGIWVRYPLGYFSTILHHTGYCFSSEQQNANKKNRNLELMRVEYKNNPNDLRMISHLIDGTAYEILEKEKYIREGLELVRKDRNNLYSNVLYMQAISHFQNSRPEYALELCDEYYKGVENIDKCVATVAVVSLKAKILSALARNEEAAEAFQKYLELYDDYKNDRLILTDASAHPIESVSEHEYKVLVYTAALNLKQLRKYNEAFSLLEMFDVEKLDGKDFKDFLGTIRSICVAKQDYVQMARYYEKLCKLDNKDKRSLAVYMLESTYFALTIKSERLDFAKDIVESGAAGKYIGLMKLVLKSENGENIDDDIIEFIKNVDDWTDGYSEIIYLAVKNKIDISSYVTRIEASQYRSSLEKLTHVHDDFAKYILDYGMPDGYSKAIKPFYWLVSAYEKASYRSFSLSESERYELYNRFLSLLGDYVINVYNPELLNDEDIDVLPNLHKFGYYMYNALEARNNGDNIGYIRQMKKALVSCESMKEIVQFMLEQFKKTM